MLDIKLIRENPEKINELLKRRSPDLSIDEVIKIDGTILEITSTAISHKIYNDTNYKLPRIVNDINKRTNIFKVEGNCTLTMKYRPIRKVVI